MECDAAAALNRHDLAVLTPAGREWAAADLAAGRSGWGAPPDLPGRARLLCAEMLRCDSLRRPLPGIVRRSGNGSESVDGGSAAAGGSLALGFVFPDIAGHRRIRLPCRVSWTHIERIVTPDAVARLPFTPRTPALQALAEIAGGSAEDRCRLGVWGSCALEVFTGYPYTDRQSDLDLLLMEAAPGAVDRMLAAAERMLEKYMVRVEIELRLPGGWGVNARELMEGSGSILAKGLSGVRLMPRDEARRLLERRA